LLLELGRTGDAVTALHEAVRVLGASGGGDVAGGAGVAGTLLNRALELWALEGHERDQRAIEASARSSSTSRPANRTRETRGLARTGTNESNRRRIRHPTHEEEWTDEVTHYATPETADGETIEERIEMDLDDKAESMLGRALGRVRPGGRQRRTPRPVSPVIESDTPARSTRRERAQRSQSRQ